MSYAYTNLIKPNTCDMSQLGETKMKRTTQLDLFDNAAATIEGHISDDPVQMLVGSIQRNLSAIESHTLAARGELYDLVAVSKAAEVQTKPDSPEIQAAL